MDFGKSAIQLIGYPYATNTPLGRRRIGSRVCVIFSHVLYHFERKIIFIIEFHQKPLHNIIIIVHPRRQSIQNSTFQTHNAHFTLGLGTDYGSGG